MNSQLPEALLLKSLPRGIPYIIGNEAAERYSYYGMKSILVIYMTKYLVDGQGTLDVMTQTEALQWYHSFGSAVYFFPIMGALISDIFWSKYKTIINLSIVYCLGHLVLSLLENRMGLAIGLSLIAIGSGGIKPCVASHLGDQFKEENKHLLSKVYSAFYFSVNFGSFFSTLLTPLTLKYYGPSVAFGIPGILMGIATIIFYLGRKQYHIVPAVGVSTFKQDVFSREGIGVILKLMGLYFFVAVFWSLFEQTGSAWVLQADKMDRMVDLNFGLFDFAWLRFEMLPSQVHSMNPILVMLLIPVFNLALYPFIDRVFKFTPLRKITTGLFITSLAYFLAMWIESQLEAGVVLNVGWQIIGYVIITAGEVMVAITALEYSYTQAPPSMKSLMMSVKYLSVTLGNLIAVAVNWSIEDESGQMTITGAEYYQFFALLMLATAVVFVGYAMWFKEKNYIQAAG